MYDIGWLAGRSYNIVRLTLPVRFRDQGELLRGSFMPVLWESLADPIVTGRDELGHPKLWAEIPDPVVSAGGEDVRGSSWLGFPFFEIEATGLQDAPPPAAGGPGHVLTAKYVPRTGAWGEPDVVPSPTERCGHRTRSSSAGRVRAASRFTRHGGRTCRRSTPW